MGADSQKQFQPVGPVHTPRTYRRLACTAVPCGRLGCDRDTSEGAGHPIGFDAKGTLRAYYRPGVGTSTIHVCETGVE